MRSKIAIVLALVCLTPVLGMAVVKSKRGKVVASPKGAVQIPVEVVQLPAQNGVIPAEIVKATYDSEGLSFAVRNNTHTPIDALVVIVTAKRLSVRGNEGKYSFRVIFNNAMHPAIIDAHKGKMKPKGFGEEFTYPPDPIEFENGGTLLGVSLKVDFVDFSDKTSLGDDTIQKGTNGIENKSSDRIFGMREGARKYQEWFDRLPNDEAKQAALRQQELPANIEFANEFEKVGAKKLRMHLLNHQHKDQ